MQAYIDTDQRLHLLAQMLTKANQAYVMHEDDDGHTNLFFDPISMSIYGRWKPTATGRALLTIDLSNYCFNWLDDNWQVLCHIPFRDRTISEIEDGLAEHLPTIGLRGNAFKQDLHYDIPDYGFSEHPFTSLNDTAVEDWMCYRQLANEACFSILGHLQVPGEVRIWPHHFDTGIYVQPNNRLGVGFGLAIQDSLVEVPYFYLSAYGLGNVVIDYSTFSTLQHGEWKVTEHFKGAIFRLDEMARIEPAKRHPCIFIFINETMQWYLKQC